MNDELRNVTVIRLREAFLESAPQLALHSYIMAQDGITSIGKRSLVTFK